jgi:Domain of unknown function (DUF4331)
MLTIRTKKWTALAVIMSVGFFNAVLPLAQVRAADHAESTSVAGDPGADIGDVFAFLDPNDNTKVILALDVEGFVVPSELANLSFFAEDVLYRFEIENTGDAVSDMFIDVTFAKQTARTAPQGALITLSHPGVPGRRPQRMTAPTTVQTLASAANPFTVTTSSTLGISFFAGLTDDPFYFDIPGFNRFVSSVLGGSPDPTKLQRGRDSFAGYNIHMIVLSVPAATLRGTSGTIGVQGVTLRKANSARQDDHTGSVAHSGNYVQVDRMATPAVNTALIPFARKNEYNASTPADDANGRFAGSIVGTLTALGTSSDNIGVLASVAVAHGDYLRLNLDQPNSSLGFGERITTPNYTGFPNGRRFGDDTVDTLLYFITNQAILMGDNVNSNEVPLGSSFPYAAPPNQPLEDPAVDNTRN